MAPVTEQHIGRDGALSGAARFGLVVTLVLAVLPISLYLTGVGFAEEPLALPPRTARHFHEGSPNAFADCRWREPSAVLFLRVPKTATSAVSNAFRKVNRWRRFDLVELPEFPPAVGAVAGTKRHAGVSFASFLRSLGARLFRAAVQGRQGKRSVLEGHVVLHDDGGDSKYFALPRIAAPLDVAIIGTARAPLERLASGYHYTREKPMDDESRARLLERLGAKSLGECAVDERCAAANELGRLCSFHTLYYCGHHRDCELGEDGVATDAAAARALRNIEDDGKVLLVIPSERLMADGYAMLERLLPSFFTGIAAAGKAVDEEGEGRSYDARTTRKSLGPSAAARLPSDAEQLAALTRLCRQDLRVFERVRTLFEERVQACALRPRGDEL